MMRGTGLRSVPRVSDSLGDAYYEFNSTYMGLYESGAQWGWSVWVKI